MTLNPPLFSPLELPETVRRHDVDFLFPVLATLLQIVDITPEDELLLPTVRFLMPGAAPLSPSEETAIMARLNSNFFGF